jgi:hypothetical protein
MLLTASWNLCREKKVIALCKNSIRTSALDCYRKAKTDRIFISSGASVYNETLRDTYGQLLCAGASSDAPIDCYKAAKADRSFYSSRSLSQDILIIQLCSQSDFKPLF